MRILAHSIDGSVDFLVDDEAPIGEEFTQPEVTEEQIEEVSQDAEESSIPEEEVFQDEEQSEESNVEEELGDLLFAAVKVGRFAGVDGEQALHGACEKFIRRFRRVEELAGGALNTMDVPELEELWRRAKRDET